MNFLFGLVCFAMLAGDTDQINALINRYTESVNTADVQIVDEVWSQRGTVTFIHPRGHERGLDQVKRNVYERLMGARFSQRKLSVKNVQVHVNGDSAWAEFDWDFDATLRLGGTAVQTHGVETQIYRREASGWRIVHVHYSAPAPPREGN